jgi:hypothetical protein
MNDLARNFRENKPGIERLRRMLEIMQRSVKQ